MHVYIHRQAGKWDTLAATPYTHSQKHFLFPAKFKHEPPTVSCWAMVGQVSKGTINQLCGDPSDLRRCILHLAGKDRNTLHARYLARHFCKLLHSPRPHPVRRYKSVWHLRNLGKGMCPKSGMARSGVLTQALANNQMSFSKNCNKENRRDQEITEYIMHNKNTYCQ